MIIYILHDTINGNGKRLSEHLKELLGEKYTIYIGDVKLRSAEEVVQVNPSMIIFVSAIRKFHNSDNMRKFFKSWQKKMIDQKKELPYAVLILTHGLPATKIKNWVKFAMKTLQTSGCIQNVYPEHFSAQVRKMEGPFADGEMEKFEAIVRKLEAWIS